MNEGQIHLPSALPTAPNGCSARPHLLTPPPPSHSCHLFGASLNRACLGANVSTRDPLYASANSSFLGFLSMHGGLYMGTFLFGYALPRPALHQERRHNFPLSPCLLPSARSLVCPFGEFQTANSEVVLSAQ